MSGKRPKYTSCEYDEAKYRAACQWLFDKKALPAPPLQEFLYQMITSDLVRPDGRWEFDREGAAKSLEVVYGGTGYTIPRKAYEQFLKHTYQGMYEAHARGVTDGPTRMGFTHTKAVRNLLVDLRDDTPMLLFANVPTFSEKLRELETLMEQPGQEAQQGVKTTLKLVVKQGFELQCSAHFLHNHATLYHSDLDECLRQMNRYALNQMAQWSRSRH